MASAVTQKLDIQWDDVRDLVSELMDELEPQIPELADEIAREMHDRVPQLHEDTALLAFTRASCVATLELIVGWVREGRDLGRAGPPHETLAFLREIIHRAVPFQAVVSSYGVGHARLNDVSLAALRRQPCDPGVAMQAALVLSRQYFAHMNAVLQVLNGEYAVERERWVRSASAVRTETVRSVLDGELVDVELASRRLGYALDQRHEAFVVWVTNPGDDDDLVHGVLERTAQDFAQHMGCRRPLLVPLSRRVVAGWIGARNSGDPATSPWSAPLLGGETIQVAMGNAEVGLGGFRRSHFEAQAARRVVDLGGDCGEGPARYDDLALRSLLMADVDQAHAFMVRQLGPLAVPSDANRRLITTVLAYLEEGCRPLGTGRRLGVHKNTVLNRVARVEELLGRGLKERSLELQIALLLARTLPDPPAEPGGRYRADEP